MQASFIATRHLQTVCREEITEICSEVLDDAGVGSGYNALYQLAREGCFADNEREKLLLKRVGGWKKGDQTKSAEALLSAQLIEGKRLADATNIKPLIQQIPIYEMIFKILRRALLTRVGSQYDGYRTLVATSGDDRTILLIYLFSGHSLPRADADFLAHSFLPDGMVYESAINRYTPGFEKGVARLSLKALNTYKPIGRRKFRFKQNNTLELKEERLHWQSSEAIKVQNDLVEALVRFRKNLDDFGFGDGIFDGVSSLSGATVWN